MEYKLNDKLDFGKYKGFTIEEVYKGWQYPTQDFIFEFFKYRFLKLSEFEFFDSKNRMYRLNVKEFELLINNEIKVVCESTIGSLSKNLVTDLNIVLSAAEEAPHRFHFDSANDFILKQRKDLSKNYKIFSDPTYILWCIENVPKFYLYDNDLVSLKDIDINVFSGIKIKPVYGNLYEYSVRYSKRQSLIVDKIIIINHKKNSANDKQHSYR